MSQLWILKSKGEESAFGGNSGYADKPMSQYVYDTNVINHDKLNVGDPVVVANKRFIIGYAKIISIKIKRGSQKNDTDAQSVIRKSTIQEKARFQNTNAERNMNLILPSSKI